MRGAVDFGRRGVLAVLETVNAVPAARTGFGFIADGALTGLHRDVDVVAAFATHAAVHFTGGPLVGERGTPLVAQRHIGPGLDLFGRGRGTHLHFRLAATLGTEGAHGRTEVHEIVVAGIGGIVERLDFIVTVVDLLASGTGPVANGDLRVGRDALERYHTAAADISQAFALVLAVFVGIPLEPLQPATGVGNQQLDLHARADLGVRPVVALRERAAEVGEAVRVVRLAVHADRQLLRRSR